MLFFFLVIISKFLCCSLLATNIAYAGWQDLSVIQKNAQLPHATMMTYPDAESALSFDREQSPWFKLLNTYPSATTSNIVATASSISPSLSGKPAD